MILWNFVCSSILICLVAAYEVHNDDDFQLLDEKIRVVRDYGKLGGPIAAGIREKKPDKEENGTDSKSTPYVPKANVNNSKKCEVIRTRVTVDNGESAQSKASKEFDDYVSKHKKVYPNDEEKEKARQVYIAGKEKTQNLNDGRCSNNDAKFSATRYSDWKPEEFVQKLGGSKQESNPANLAPLFTVTEDQSRFLWKLPRWDWRTYGVIPPVRDQLQCGGCYAFATTDCLAAQERIDNKKFNQGTVEPYSAQYFVDCMPEPLGYGCRGGRPAAVLKYMASCDDCVILIDRCYQYRNKYLRCKQASINCRTNVGAKPVFSKQVNVISNREAEAIATLLRWGPVVAVVELGPAWQYYSGKGIIRDNQCGKKANHAVLIVGYDFTGEVPYYIIKNSWSGDYGDHGYVRVEAGKNTCGIATAALVTCTDKKKCGSFKGIEDFAKNPNAKPDLKPDGTYSS